MRTTCLGSAGFCTCAKSGGPSLFQPSHLNTIFLKPVEPSHALEKSVKMIAFKYFTIALMLLFGANLHAEFKSQPQSSPVPDTVAPEIRAGLAKVGWEVVGDDGKPLLKLWLSGKVRAAATPGGAKGNILFPFLSEGEFLGVVEVISQVGDYRDQPIAPGIYTFRYGLQPVNGDHLGASRYRDFGLLIPAKKDKKPEALAKKALEHDSAEAAGTSHPAIMMFLPTAEGAKAGQIVRDEANDRTSLVISIDLNASGKNAKVLIQWVVSGRAPV